MPPPQMPQMLLNMRQRGLEIKKTKDIRSYTKLIPALKEFPDSPIVTFDDDIIYPPDALEWLYKAYKADGSKIYFRRGHRMKLAAENSFVPYANFDWEIQDDMVSPLNFPTGVGGVLYPPRCFANEVLDEDAFMRLAPYADDIWFKAMSLLNGTLSQKVWAENLGFTELDILHEEQTLRLNEKNVIAGGNDVQLKAVWDKYGLWGKMQE